MSDAQSPLLQSLSASPSLSPSLELKATTIPTLPTPFDQTTQNLLKLGSLTMDRFAQDPSEELDGFDIPLVDPANPNASGYYLGDTTAARHAGQEEEEPDEIPNVAATEAVRYLREVAHREFGTTSTDPLKYEFLDEPGQNRKSCILTISRPNGLSRSYRTKAEFSRKSEAKIAAASSAIQLGAVRFIKHGEESKVVGKRGLVLAKLDAAVKKDEGEMKLPKLDGPEVEVDDSSVSQIDACCAEWRAGSVVPTWVYLIEQKLPDAYGCALKITLSTHIQRTYSVAVSVDYSKKSLAKAACACIALQQGIIEFIKHGDGLEHPIVVPFEGAETQPPPPPPTITTLQAYHAALPKPLPDQIGTKSNGEINAVAWLNTLVQVAKGSRMTVTFNWHSDAKLGLHGCLLRLSRPDDVPSQSYLVDAIFSKRADAKIAVCLLACSQGVGDYIRGIAAEIDARVTADMRRRCSEHILPALGQALNRFRHGSRPDFSYDCDLATFGCTLTVDLSPDSETLIKRQWTVPLAYKSKADAKIAVACAAAEEGLMDFIKYRGKTPPLADDLASDAEAVKQAPEVELEEGETTMDGEKKKKKRKKGKKDAADGGAGAEDDADDMDAGDGVKKVPLFETREEALARGRSHTSSGKKQQQQQFHPYQQQQRNINGRGRGGNFGRPPFRGGLGGNNTNARVNFSQSGFGAPPSRSVGPPPPFSVPSHFSGVPPPFHQPPYVPPSHGPGYPGGAYGSEFEHHDRGFHRSDPGLAHGRQVPGPGGARANAATSFAHAPPPAPLHMAPPYNGHREHEPDYDYHHEREYRPGPYTQPPFSGAIPPGPSFPPGPPRPYGYEYPAVAPPPVLPPHAPPHAYHQTVAAEYGYEHDEYAGRPAQGVSRLYEPEHYAPDYDRIPDRSTEALHAHPYPPHSASAASPHLGTPIPHPPFHPSPSHSHASHSHPSIVSAHPPVQHQHPCPPQHPHPPPHYPHPPPHAHLPPQHRHSQVYGSQPPYLEPHAPSGPHPACAPYDRPPVQSAPHDEAMRRRNVYERRQTGEQARALASASRPPRGPVRPDPEVQSKMEEELDSVISRLEKEANEKRGGGSDVKHRPHHPRNGRGRPTQLPSPISGRKRSISNGRKSPGPDQERVSNDQNVPSKRGRSSDCEDPGSPSNKRMRGRSRSMSRASASIKSSEGTAPDKSVPPSGQANGNAPEDNKPKEKNSDQSLAVAAEDGDRKSLKRTREGSPSGEKRKGSEPKDKSYVAALFDHCEKQGMPRPEMCHEEVASDKAGKAFKVWIVMGKERLELPTSFSTLNAGQERVAKSVLGRLRVQTKKRKEA